MKEVIESLSKTAGDYKPFESLAGGEIDEAAASWAKHSLSTYTGKLLSKALDISKAMAEFTAELQRPVKQ